MIHRQISSAVGMPFKAFSFFALTALLLVGCAGPIKHPSPLMEKASPPALTPPTGKSLVLIHRPRNGQGHGLYTGVWDGTSFIADLGNGNSVACVCEPGTHYFINRSVERVGVVQAELLAGQTYDLRLDIAGAWIASFQIEPIKHGDKVRSKLVKWEKEHLWVARGARAADHEKLRASEIELILRDFASGEKKDRLRHLGPDDHR